MVWGWLFSTILKAFPIGRLPLEYPFPLVTTIRIPFLLGNYTGLWATKAEGFESGNLNTCLYLVIRLQVIYVYNMLYTNVFHLWINLFCNQCIFLFNFDWVFTCWYSCWAYNLLCMTLVSSCLWVWQRSCTAIHLTTWIFCTLMCVIY